MLRPFSLFWDPISVSFRSAGGGGRDNIDVYGGRHSISEARVPSAKPGEICHCRRIKPRWQAFHQNGLVWHRETP